MLTAWVDHRKSAQHRPQVQGKSISFAHKDSVDAENEALSVPFEFHALEAILTTVNTLYSRKYETVLAEVNMTMTYFNSPTAVIVPFEAHEKMKNLKNSVSKMIARTDSFARAVETLLASDEDMALMNLSLFKEDQSLYR